MKPEQNEAIKIAFYKGIQGGTSGAMAMAIQVNCGTLLFQIHTHGPWGQKLKTIIHTLHYIQFIKDTF